MDKRIYLVTGGAGGIGSAICEKIAKTESRGVLLIHYNTSKEGAEALKQKLLQTSQMQIEILYANLEKKEDIEKFCKSVLQRYQKIDYLINCAGYVEDKPFSERTYEDFEKTLKINLIAPFVLSQNFGEGMVANKHGKIVNISSTNATDTLYPTSIDYDASKAGLNNLTTNLAIALAPYVNVNAIMPGWTKTPINNQIPQSELKKEYKKILTKRFFKPSEIADAVWFLLDKTGDGISATVWRVDGGLRQDW